MIATALYGGLGNQMFQYAMVRAMSLRLGCDMAFNSRTGFQLDYDYHRHLELHHFGITLPQCPIVTFDYGICGRILRKASEVVGRNVVCPWYKMKHEHIGSDGRWHFDAATARNRYRNIYIEGYWLSEEYFKDFADVIRDDFSIKTPIPQRVIDELKTWKKDGKTLVFVGVRRYQEVTCLSPEWLLDERYYNSAIAYVESIIPNPKFVVFSQEIEWAKCHLKSKSPMVFATPKSGDLSAIEDLYLMTHCEHAIISNSTFYWWGAWLQKTAQREHIVVCPNNFQNIDSVCKNWIMMTPLSSSNQADYVVARAD